MPARLLAYGGTSFSERRRIGPWPAIPEATLRDSYGLQPNAWCFGMGVLTGQPFLIFRQRQNVENRGGYPFSLLLDPGPDLWQRFEWNGAAVIAALLDSIRIYFSKRRKPVAWTPWTLCSAACILATPRRWRAACLT